MKRKSSSYSNTETVPSKRIKLHMQYWKEARKRAADAVKRSAVAGSLQRTAGNKQSKTQSSQSKRETEDELLTPAHLQFPGVLQCPCMVADKCQGGEKEFHHHLGMYVLLFPPQRRYGWLLVVLGGSG